jgi:hypothetical protein
LEAGLKRSEQRIQRVLSDFLAGAETDRPDYTVSSLGFGHRQHWLVGLAVKRSVVVTVDDIANQASADEHNECSDQDTKENLHAPSSVI